MDEPKSTNITWHHATVTRTDREERNRNRGVVLWYTGLSGCGKSTVANEVEKRLFDMSCQTYVLDGDNIRFGLNKNLGFSPEARTENIRRIGEVAKLFVDSGILVSTAFISPYRDDRDAVREPLIGAKRLLRVRVLLAEPLQDRRIVARWVECRAAGYQRCSEQQHTDQGADAASGEPLQAEHSLPSLAIDFDL